MVLERHREDNARDAMNVRAARGKGLAGRLDIHLPPQFVQHANSTPQWDPKYRIKVRVICARAYHALFMVSSKFRYGSIGTDGAYRTTC